jgi:hypothetical protein
VSFRRQSPGHEAEDRHVWGFAPRDHWVNIKLTLKHHVMFVYKKKKLTMLTRQWPLRRYTLRLSQERNATFTVIRIFWLCSKHSASGNVALSESVAESVLNIISRSGSATNFPDSRFREVVMDIKRPNRSVDVYRNFILTDLNFIQLLNFTSGTAEHARFLGRKGLLIDRLSQVARKISVNRK